MLSSNPPTLPPDKLTCAHHIRKRHVPPLVLLFVVVEFIFVVLVLVVLTPLILNPHRLLPWELPLPGHISARPIPPSSRHRRHITVTIAAIVTNAATAAHRDFLISRIPRLLLLRSAVQASLAFRPHIPFLNSAFGGGAGASLSFDRTDGTGSGAGGGGGGGVTSPRRQGCARAHRRGRPDLDHARPHGLQPDIRASGAIPGHVETRTRRVRQITPARARLGGATDGGRGEVVVRSGRSGGGGDDNGGGSGGCGGCGGDFFVEAAAPPSSALLRGVAFQCDQLWEAVPVKETTRFGMMESGRVEQLFLMRFGGQRKGEHRQSKNKE